MSAEANKAVFREHMQAMNEHRLDTLADHPAGVVARPFFEQLFAAFPDSSISVHEVIAEDDWVAYRMMSRGTQRGEWMGISPTNRQVEYEVIGTMRIVDGKIVEAHGQADQMAMMQQLGVLPEPARA